MRPSDTKTGAFSFEFFFSPPIRNITAVLMWAEGRWCSAAWGRRSGRSCWTVCSCSPPQTEAPGRPEPGARRREGVGGRQLVEPGRRGVGVGKNPASPPWRWTDVTDVVEGESFKKNNLNSKSIL